MLIWIDCRHQAPPQNEKLLWCWMTRLKDGSWEDGIYGIGIYRFGSVKGSSLVIPKLSNYVKSEHTRIYWARFNKPTVNDIA